MRVFFVDSDQEGGMYGPYSKTPLAETALKIVQMTKDEAAELVSYDMDPFGEQLQSGLRPFKVEIMLLDGKVQNIEVSLRWPPQEVEGLVTSREDYQEHFVWARTKVEAKVRAASLASKAPRAAACEAEPGGSGALE